MKIKEEPTKAACIVFKRITNRNRDSEYTCLIDKAYNELLDIYDESYSELFHILHDKLNLEIKVNRGDYLPDELLFSSNIVIIGCPFKKNIADDDIEHIVKYVREGGNLLVISDAGGDLANETNVNDLIANFNIEVESTTVRDTHNLGSSVSPIIENVNLAHPINKNVMRVVIGGGATLLIEDPATPVFSTNKSAVIEKFSPNDYESAWKIMKVGENYPIAAAISYGQGKVCVCGDVDMFNNELDYGIKALDNSYFVRNIFNWFLAPVEVSTIIDWLVLRIANLEGRFDTLQDNYDKLKRENESLRKKLKGILHHEESLRYSSGTYSGEFD